MSDARKNVPSLWKLASEQAAKTITANEMKDLPDDIIDIILAAPLSAFKNALEIILQKSSQLEENKSNNSSGTPLNKGLVLELENLKKISAQLESFLELKVKSQNISGSILTSIIYNYGNIETAISELANKAQLTLEASKQKAGEAIRALHESRITKKFTDSEIKNNYNLVQAYSSLTSLIYTASDQLKYFRRILSVKAEADRCKTIETIANLSVELKQVRFK